MEILSFFLLGFLGSLHCIGMCGPIVLALPLKGSKDTLKRILYNGGRVITYSVMGLGAGFIGSRCFMAGLQQDMSIIFGASIILYVIIPSSLKTKVSSSSFMSVLYRPVKKHIGKLFAARNSVSFLSMGLLNGLLPCGFVYMALAASVVTGTPLKGASAMALFGLGTVPALFFFSIASGFFTISLRNRIKKYMPALAVVLGVIFILRGLNLGIPYVSPKIAGSIHSVVDEGCCGDK
jgi:uncharacterized protein